VTRPRRRPQSNLLTLALSVALAVTVGAIVYLATTSLPFLAVSPTSDPTFGALNECLLSAAPQRVGFAVGRDARRAAAWTNDEVVECREGEAAAVVKLPGATVGAYDGRGRLWVAARGPDAGATGLFLLKGGEAHAVGELSPQALAGTREGVVALEPSGRLVAFSGDGAVTATRTVAQAGDAALSTSGDGQRAAVRVGGGLVALDATTLEVVRAEAPCAVERLWWLKGGHRVLVGCGPGESWALVLDVDTGQSEAAPARARVEALLVGPEGPWVRPCDVLPCTAEEP